MRSKEIRKKQDYRDDFFLVDALADSASRESTGQGGSLARFKIVSHYLYALDASNLKMLLER